MTEASKGALVLMLVFALVGGFACDGGDSNSITSTVPTIVGSGNIVQETRSVTGATGVDLLGAANLTIEQGAPEEIMLQTDDNLMVYILTDVQNGILLIRRDSTVNLKPSQTMVANLALNIIDNITFSGAGSITIPGLTTNQLELTRSGVGDIEISNLDALTLDVLLSGIGDISVTGQVEDQIITITQSSLGDYDAENLSSATADVEIAGGGSATIRVSTTLNANITGSGSVLYYGSPVVTRTGAGTGNVVQISP